MIKPSVKKTGGTIIPEKPVYSATIFIHFIDKLVSILSHFFRSKVVMITILLILNLVEPIFIVQSHSNNIEEPWFKNEIKKGKIIEDYGAQVIVCISAIAAARLTTGAIVSLTVP